MARFTILKGIENVAVASRNATCLQAAGDIIRAFYQLYNEEWDIISAEEYVEIRPNFSHNSKHKYNIITIVPVAHMQAFVKILGNQFVNL
jgi:hypothetical protein